MQEEGIVEFADFFCTILSTELDGKVLIRLCTGSFQLHSVSTKNPAEGSRFVVFSFCRSSPPSQFFHVDSTDPA
jgi:hypothetical protein